MYACGSDISECNLAVGGIMIAANDSEALPFNTNNITFTNNSIEEETTIVVHLLRKS